MKLTDVIRTERSWRSGGPFSKGMEYKYSARIGSYGPQFSGKTKEEAVETLVKELERQERYLFSQTIRWAPDGSCWILTYRYGWSYSIRRPGDTVGSSCSMGADLTERQALDKMEEHLKQYAENCAYPAKDAELKSPPTT